MLIQATVDHENTFAKGWYAILPSNLLSQHKPLAITRFGLALVLWRDKNKQVKIFVDRCPHRGAQLSLGKIINGCIECPFHGYRFDEAGKCSFAPEFNKAIPGLRLTQFAAHESCHMIWMYWGEKPEVFQYSLLEEMHHHFSGYYSSLAKVWHSHITYCIENQLDYTHLRFVHHNTIGRGYKMPTEPQEICDPHSITICLKNPEVIATQYFFPNVWILHISQRMKLVLFFVPINAHYTQLYLRAYRNFLTLPIINKIVDSIMNLSNRIILKQDEKVVASQGLLPSYEAKNDLLMRYDKAIRYFRETWQHKCID
jgi:phenylpropionate dioxygenase-like ring-hydroxylating dioxygenase large terminal subunit